MEWRKQFDGVFPEQLRGKSKFPFAIYLDNSKLPDLNFRDAVRALVLRNSGIIKKRYPCMPSIVIAATPSSPDSPDVQSCVRKCHFGIGPLSCVWFLSDRIDIGADSNLQNLQNDTAACFSVCDTMLFYVIDDLISGKHKSSWDKFQRRVKPNYHQDHAAVDFVKSVLNAPEHTSVIHALAQAKAVVLVNNSKSKTSERETAFISICQMIRNMNFCDDSAAFKHRSDCSKLPRVFVVPDASDRRRPDYVQAFRTGAHLLLARGTFPEPLSIIKNSGINHSLPTFYFCFQSVSLTLRSIELFFRYFLHHMAFVKRERVPDNIQFFLHNQINIAERVEKLKKDFLSVLENTYIFSRPGDKKLDWDHLCFMFQCLSLLQKDCMLSSNKEIKGMWEIFSQSKTKETFFQPFDLKSLAQKIEARPKNEKELANETFTLLLRTFTFHWTEPFCPDSATDKDFYNPAHEIAEICESSKIFMIPLLQPDYMSFGLSRIAIDSHLSASVRFLGETALMSAACGGNLKRVKLLIEGSSLSQIMSRSQHPEAEGLDALFMSLFYAQIRAATLIVHGMLKEFSDQLSKIDRNPLECQHKVLGCTTFMLACRYGDKDLLDAMFELLDEYTLNHTFETKDHSQGPDLSISDYRNSERNRLLMRQDRNGANALHHAIISANVEAVQWLKEKRAAFQTEAWLSELSKEEREKLKWRCNVSNQIPDLDHPENQYGFWFEEEEAGQNAGKPEEIWKKRPSVFQSGHVAEEASASVLSPAFALIYLLPKTNDLSFLNRAIHDDYNLLFQLLYRVDSHILCQVEYDVTFSKTKETNFESLKEYELAVMMWRWCDSKPSTRKLSAKSECDWKAPGDLVQTGPEEDTKDIYLAHRLMERAFTSQNEVHRQLELDGYEESDAKVVQAIKEESETNIRQEIALQLTEFSEEKPDDSPWFNVCFPSQLLRFALIHLQAASDDIQLNRYNFPTWILILFLTLASIYALYSICLPSPTMTNDLQFPQPLVAIAVLQIVMFSFSQRQVLGVFAKIFMFTICGLAFTMTCMSYTGITMIDNNELVGVWPPFRPALPSNCRDFSFFTCAIWYSPIDQKFAILYPKAICCPTMDLQISRMSRRYSTTTATMSIRPSIKKISSCTSYPWISIKVWTLFCSWLYSCLTLTQLRTATAPSDILHSGRCSAASGERTPKNRACLMGLSKISLQFRALSPRCCGLLTSRSCTNGYLRHTAAIACAFMRMWRRTS
jgi:hypothetical protein